MWASRMRRRASASTAARSARLLTPIVTREVVGEVGGDGVAGLAQRREDVGQVVLALGVVVGEAGEGVGQRRRVEGVGAGVDLADRQLLGVGVAGGFGLDHALDLAAGAADDAAVGAGVVELDRQHRRRAPARPRGPRAGRRSSRPRSAGVAGEDEHGLARLDQRQGGADRAAGAVGLGLDRRSRRPRAGRRRCRARARRSPRPARRRPRARRGSARRPSAARRRDAASSAGEERMRVPSPPP